MRLNKKNISKIKYKVRILFLFLIFINNLSFSQTTYICVGDDITTTASGYETATDYEQFYVLVKTNTGNIVTTNSTGTFTQTDYGTNFPSNFNVYAVNTNDSSVIAEMNTNTLWINAYNNASVLCADIIGPLNFSIIDCTPEIICDGDSIYVSASGFETISGYSQYYVLVNLTTGNIAATNTLGLFTQTDYGAGNLDTYEVHAVNTNNATVISEINTNNLWTDVLNNIDTLCFDEINKKYFTIEHCCILQTSITETAPSCETTSDASISIDITGNNYDIYLNGNLTSYTNISNGNYNLNNLSAGTYSVHIIDVEDTNCDTTINITINQGLAQITPVFTIPDTYCFGDEITALPTISNNGIIGIWSPLIDNTQTTSYTFFPDSGECAINTTQTIAINSLPTPTIIGNNFCEGTSTVLDAGAGYQLYSWSSQGAETQIITTTTGGNYSVEVTDSNACVAIANIDIIMYPLPTINLEETIDICLGESDTLIATSSATSFEWDNNLGSGNTQIVTPNITTTYTVTVTDDNNCKANDDITVNVHNIPTTTLNPTNVSCNGLNNGNINLTVSGGQAPYSYNWSNNKHTEDINNLSPDNYSVTVEDTYNCANSDSANITEPDSIIINLASNNANCYGDANMAINTNVSGGFAPYTYNWNNGANTQNLVNITAGNYTLSVVDNNLCNQTASITILQPDELIVELPDNFTYCKQNSILHASVIGGNQPYSYSWNTGELTSDITFSTNYTATYTVSVTDNNNCTNQTSVNIIIPTINISATANSDTVCIGNPINIYSQITGGTAPYNILINGETANSPYAVYPNNETETYEINVIDNCDLSDITQITLHTYPTPAISFNADILEGCPPLKVHFNLNSYNDNYQYNWDFGDVDENNLSLNNNPVHIFDYSGYYNITLKVIDKYACKNELTISNMIHIFPTPEAHFYTDKDVVSFINSSIDFSNCSINNYVNIWSFGDGDSSLFENPIHKYKEIGFYYPKLIVENEYACKDTAVKQIEVKDIVTLYIPTAFSPDNDGINDGFRVVGHGIDLDNFTLIIYDRWGEIIWQSNDMFEVWNGTVKGNNRLAQNGTYKCLVIYNDFNNIQHTQSGNVTIIR